MCLECAEVLVAALPTPAGFVVIVVVIANHKFGLNHANICKFLPSKCCVLFFFFLSFCISRAALVTYGSSQARSLTRAVAAG